MNTPVVAAAEQCAVAIVKRRTDGDATFGEAYAGFTYGGSKHGGVIGSGVHDLSSRHESGAQEGRSHSMRIVAKQCLQPQPLAVNTAANIPAYPIARTGCR